MNVYCIYIFLYRSFDKRKDFNFEIVKYPTLFGNIPKSPSYGVFTSQLVRFCLINQNVGGFIADVKEMVKDFHHKGFLLERLRSCYQTFCVKHLQKWSKYELDITVHKYLNKIFPKSKM